MTKAFEQVRKIYGRIPLISFMGLNYGSRTLARRKDLVGSIAVITIHPYDIRTLKVRLKSGPELGTLEMIGVKSNEPVSLEAMRTLMQAKRKIKVKQTKEIDRVLHSAIKDGNRSRVKRPSKKSRIIKVEHTAKSKEVQVRSMRLKYDEKMDLAQSINRAALKLLNQQGEPAKVSGGHCLSYTKDNISILHTTPFTDFYGSPAPYGIDIWIQHKKVFSYWWEPGEIVCFKYGPWMNTFVPGSYFGREKRKEG